MVMKPTVIVIGSGFAGVEAVKTLSDECGESIECVWISSSGKLVFLPALPELAGGRLEESDVSWNVGEYAKRHGFTLVRDRVERVEEKRVLLSGGDNLSYDYVLLATGARPAFFNVPGAEEHAYPLYSIEAALRIREQAKRVENAVIVGAGFVGVEVAAELRHLNPSLSVTIVDMLDEPLKTLGNKRASRLVASDLTRMGVKQIYGARVTRVTPESVETTRGVFKAELVVWAAGLQANTPEISVNVQRVKGGFIAVDEYLRAAPRLYVAGDASCVSVKSCTALKMVREAIRQGKTAASNILREIKGGRLHRYKPLITNCRPLAGVTLGPHRGVLIVGKSLALRTSLVEWYKEWQRRRYARRMTGV